MLDQKMKKQLDKLKPEIKNWLKDNVTEKRYKHIIGVAKTARKYAKKLKLDYFKAELSGLLHDCAKELTNPELLRIAKRKKIKLDKIDFQNPHILHARVGAMIAKEKFRIKDKDVLAGIRCHTLAEPDMTKLAMVVYLADSTEPGRNKEKSTAIRKTLKNEGLERAVLHAIDEKLVDVIKKERLVHPYTINARNWLIENIRLKR